MKKRIFLLFFLFNILIAFGQLKSPLTNLENFDEKPLQWGYYFGGNMFDLKFDYRDLHYTNTSLLEVQTHKMFGFNVGLTGSARLMKYIDLRLEPGLVYNRKEIYFYNMTEKRDYLRDVKSTYIYIPLLVKFSAERWYNFKPYVTAGGSMTINLSSNQNLTIDNYDLVFRTKTNVFFYELGFGLDIYTPFFRLSPSIRGLFSVRNELVPDHKPDSPWTKNLNGLKSRGFLINLTLE